MDFGLNIMMVDVDVINSIEQERLDNLTNSSVVLEAIEPEIHVLGNNKQWYMVKVKFHGIDAKAYLPDYTLAGDETYSIVKKYKDRQRVYITETRLDDNWMIQKTREIAEIKATAINDKVNSHAYHQILREIKQVSNNQP